MCVSGWLHMSLVIDVVQPRSGVPGFPHEVCVTRIAGSGSPQQLSEESGGWDGGHS